MSKIRSAKENSDQASPEPIRSTVTHILRYDLLNHRDFRDQVMLKIEHQYAGDFAPKSVWNVFLTLAQAYLTDADLAISDVHLISQISRSSAGRGLDVLERARAVHRDNDQADRRRKLVSLTPEFTQILDRYVEHCFAEFGELIALHENRARRKSERALQESEAVLGAIIESSMDAVVSVDADGQIIEFNPAAEEIFGIKREAALGNDMVQLIVPPRLRERHRSGIAKRKNCGETFHRQRMETDAQRFDGQEFPIELTVHRLSTSGETIFSAFIRDITEKRANEQTRDLAQRMGAIGQLTGGIAHEFNNILQAIITNLQLLEDYVTDDQAFELINQASKSVFRGSKLTDYLLGYSRNRMLYPQEVDISKFLPESIEQIQASCDTPPIIELEIAQHLPKVQVDRRGLQHALGELVKNAQTASTNGSSVRIRARHLVGKPDSAGGKTDDYVSLEVIDKGIGMDQETCEHALEPFFTTKDIGQGEGLGLSVVWGFATQSGGSLNIQSKPDEGTTIQLLVPALID